jgi:hypothetical protein
MQLFVHQMAGVDTDRMREVYSAPEDFEPMTGCAVGYPGDPGQLPEDWMREAEQAQRDRLPLSAIVFGERWGDPAPLVTD